MIFVIMRCLPITVAALPKALGSGRSFAGFLFRIPPVAWMSVSTERCVLSRRVYATGRSLAQRRSTDSFVSKNDFENSTMRRPKPTRAVGS